MAESKWTAAMDGSPAEVDLIEAVVANPRTDGVAGEPQYDRVRHRHPSGIRFWNYDGHTKTTPSYGFGVQKPMQFSILRSRETPANDFAPISQQSPEQRAAHYARLAAFRSSVCNYRRR